MKKIIYNGSSKVIQRLCEVVNEMQGGGSGGTGSLVDTNTTYTLKLEDNDLVLTPSDGEAQRVPLPEHTDNDTTYTMTLSGRTIKLKPSSGKEQSVTVPAELPAVSTSDSGKVLRVNSSGTWEAQALANADTTEY